MHFNEILRILIEENNLTQKKLAEKLQIPVSTLGGYVQGTSEPDFDTLKLIADYFDVTTDFLLCRKTGTENSFEEKNILRIFRALTPDEQAIYIEQGRAFIKAKQRKSEK